MSESTRIERIVLSLAAIGFAPDLLRERAEKMEEIILELEHRRAMEAIDPGSPIVDETNDHATGSSAQKLGMSGST